MPSGLLLALVLIPSMLLVYVVLATIYGGNKAYIAISWLPIAYVLVIRVFQLLLEFQHLSDEWWRSLATIVGSASLVQAGLGVGLIVRSQYRHQGSIGLLLATLLSAFPFFLRFIR